MKTLDQIKAAILSSDLSFADLKEISEEIRVANSRLQRQARDAFIPGYRVSVVIRGEKRFGKVVRILKKNVAVILDDGAQYRVSPSLLTVEASASEVEAAESAWRNAKTPKSKEALGFAK